MAFGSSRMFCLPFSRPLHRNDTQSMRRSHLTGGDLTVRLIACLLSLAVVHPARAGTPNPDRFALRVYIFNIASGPERGRPSKHPRRYPTTLPAPARPISLRGVSRMPSSSPSAAPLP